MAKKKCVIKSLAAGGLKAKSKSLGLDNALVLKLIEIFGTQLVTLLFRALQSKQKLQAGIGSNLVKRLIIDFIVNSKDEVLSWIEAGEDALYDTLVSMVAALGSDVLAELLEGYKDKLTAFDDDITEEILDRVIDAIRNTGR